MRILLIDDHAIVRMGLRHLLTSQFGNVNFGEAGNVNQGLELLRIEKWDLVILDITMPGQSGLEALRQIRKLAREAPVLILSMHPEKEFAVLALKRGASGYVAKDRATEELGNAVRKVISGGRYVSPEVGESLAAQIAGQGPRVPQESLSEREFQVMRMLSTGLTVTEIANDLSLSVKTVSTFRTRVLKKMNFRNNADMMRYALDHQLVE
jgi:two-component system invasion response regulator UvrY